MVIFHSYVSLPEGKCRYLTSLKTSAASIQWRRSELHGLFILSQIAIFFSIDEWWVSSLCDTFFNWWIRWGSYNLSIYILYIYIYIIYIYYRYIYIYYRYIYIIDIYIYYDPYLLSSSELTKPPNHHHSLHGICSGSTATRHNLFSTARVVERKIVRSEIVVMHISWG